MTQRRLLPIVIAASGLTLGTFGGALALAPAQARAAAAVQIFQAGIPGGADIRHLVAGPDGNIWFTERATRNIASITSTGQVSTKVIPYDADTSIDDDGPETITSSGGGIWFDDLVGQQTWRYDVATGTLKEPRQNFDSVRNLAPADNGGVWENNSGGQDINLYAANGSTYGTATTSYNDPYALTEAPGNGGAWYADTASGGQLRHIDDQGNITSIPLGGAYGEVDSIAFDRSGGLWWTQYLHGHSLGPADDGGLIGHLVNGQPVYSPLGPASGINSLAPGNLQLGPDGALWFTAKDQRNAGNSYNGRRDIIGRLDPSTGVIQLSTAGSYTYNDFTFASDGSLWFLDTGANSLGRIASPLSALPAVPGSPVLGTAASAPGLHLCSTASKAVRGRCHVVLGRTSLSVGFISDRSATLTLRVQPVVAKGHKRPAAVTVATKKVKKGTTSISWSLQLKHRRVHGRYQVSLVSSAAGKSTTRSVTLKL